MLRPPPDAGVSFAGTWAATTTVMPYGSCRFINRRGSCLNFAGNAISRDPTPTQDYTRIKIGDVGFIDKGKFHLLFSAGSPLGERQLGRDVPDKFESLSVGTPTCGEPRKPDCLRTSTVRHIGAGLGTTEFISRYVPFLGPPSTFSFKNAPPRLLENRASCSFELTGDCGAALLTMDPTYPEDSPAKSEFDEYTKRHYESWVNFSRHKHGRDDIRPILVSGFDMTKNFAMVAYSRKDTSNQEYFHDFPMFSSAFAPFEGTWRANFTPYTNHGPPQSEGAGSLANECNQCVFIRYYITRTRGWWARLRNELARVGGRLRDSDSGSNGGNASPGPTGGSNVKPTASDDRPPGIQGGDTDSEPGIMIRNTQDVWSSSPCPLSFALISTFRTRDMTVGMSSQITYSR